MTYLNGKLDWAGKAIIGIMLCASLTFGQSFKSTLVGQVTDQNGAAVPNATITITEQTTNKKQTVITNEEGNYVIPQLDPGSYSMKIESPNFKTSVRTDMMLETGQTARFNIALEAGNISEEVTVTAEPAVINAETSSKGEVITQRQVQDLPLNGRDFTSLALLAPGVYPRPADDDQGEGLAAAGTRTDASNFILDGIVNKSDRNGSVGVNTSIDSIREFKVETSTYTAEFGRSAGAQVNVVSKSGSNRFSGSIFEYLRNDAFDAKNFFTAPDEDKTLRRHQFGGSIGGPMPFFNFGEGGPAFTNGKDRTFFFVSYEGTRQERSESALSTAPRASWLMGDFRDVLGAGNDLILGTADDVANSNQIRCITSTGLKVVCPTPNVIPTSNTVVGSTTVLGINPISLMILQRLPSANMITPQTPFGYAATVLGKTNRDQLLARVDHKINDRNNASFRFSQQKGDGFDPFPSNRNFYPTFGRDTKQNYKNMAFSDNHVFSARIINEFRFGIFSQNSENLGENRDQDYISLFGISGLPTASVPEVQGFPAIRIDGFSEFGDRPNDPFSYKLNNHQIYDAITAIYGNHSMKLGIDMIRSNYKEADVRNVRGDFRFRGRNTNTGTGTSSGYRSFADFLYGLPDATQRQIGAEPADLTGSQYAFFIQDDWRLANWLTLNMGLRYELQTPLYEASGRIGNFVPEFGTTILSGDPRLPKGLIETDKNNWGPRVGFAMRPFKDDKTVIRGGAGIYFSLESFNPIRQQLANTFPFLQRESYSRLSSNPLLLSFQNPFPNGQGGIQGLTTPFGLQVAYRTPEIYQYNLTVERELATDLALEVGYVGSLGRNLGQRYNLNALYPTGAVTSAVVNGVTVYTPVTARLFPTLGDIQFQEQIARSNYNGLQTSLRRRSKGGLTMLVSYTYSKAIDTASSTNNSTTGTQKFPQDVRNLNGEKALADFDRRHQLTASYNYSLPFGKGRRYLSSANGVTDFFLGGWQMNGIYTYLSGRPFTPQYSSADVAQQRPDIIGDPYSNIPVGLAFNPAAFTRPLASPTDPTFFGNAGRNILTGPDFSSMDMSLMKNFRITERAKVQFRWEVFNVLNRTNFQVPVFLLDSSSVGTYGQTANENREMQFALKLIF
ncbi:MAG: TonB-dependent receptor [Pyrinomonadaceae bacterium]